jgi:hypothetical protein
VGIFLSPICDSETRPARTIRGRQVLELGHSIRWTRIWTRGDTGECPTKPPTMRENTTSEDRPGPVPWTRGGLVCACLAVSAQIGGK